MALALPLCGMNHKTPGGIMCTGLTTENRKRKALRLALRSAFFLIACFTSMLANATTNHPRFAYVVNELDDSVSMFMVDAQTGQLQHNGFVRAGHFPFRLTIGPTGEFAYVGNNGSNTITQYEINPQTGVLTQVDVATVGNSPRDIVIDPTGRFMYVGIVNPPSVAAFTIDQLGAITANGPASPISSLPTSVVMDPGGKFVYASNQNTNTISGFSVNSDGTLTSLGTTPVSDTPGAIAIDHSGQFLYVALGGTTNKIQAYAIQSGVGSLVPIGNPVATDLLPVGIVIDPANQFLYAPNRNSNTVSQFHIDSVTGALTPQDLLLVGPAPVSM